MSAMPSSGFVGVSTQTILVSGRIAARTASTLCTDAAVQLSPQRSATLANRRKVPP